MNSVASLEVAVQLRKQIYLPTQRWGLYICEFVESDVSRKYAQVIRQSFSCFDVLVVPSPLARSAWEPLVPPGTQWVIIPSKDDRSLVVNRKSKSPDPRWLIHSGLKLLGFGRDQQSFDRFRKAIAHLIEFMPDLLGLWVGPVGYSEGYVVHQETVDVSLALDSASVLLVTTGGISKPGETFGLVIAEALKHGCPVFAVDHPPLGIAHWRRKELKHELVCDDLDQLLVRILKSLRDPKGDRYRRQLLASESISQLQADWSQGIRDLMEHLCLCGSSGESEPKI